MNCRLETTQRDRMPCSRRHEHDRAAVQGGDGRRRMHDVAGALWRSCGVLVLLVAAAPAGEPRRLTTDGVLKFSPVLVAEGREVVFATHESPNLVALVRL